MNKYYVKDISALYYDGKVLPVILFSDNDKYSVRFIPSNVSVPLENIVFKKDLNGKIMSIYAVLRVSNGEKRQAEIGNLYDAIDKYGDLIYKDFLDLSIVQSISKVNITNDVEVLRDFFNTELDENQISTLFKDLQCIYNKRKCVTIIEKI